MSHSYKKAIFPISCCGTHGQKQWKREYNRTFRRQQNEELKLNSDDAILLEVPYKTLAADVWSSPSDGHHRYYDYDCMLVFQRSPNWAKRRFCRFKRHNSVMAWK